MFGTYFYNESMRRMTVAFGQLFNKIQIKHKDSTGKTVQVSFGFVRLVIVALYGASLTSILIEEANTSGTIKTMSDLQNAGGKVIMFNGDPLKPRILSQNPWLIVTDVPRGEILSSTNLYT